MTIFEALLEAASHADDYRLPELFAGFSRTEFETPVPYPVACHPQAWAAGAIPYLLTSGLGLHAAGLEQHAAHPAAVAAALGQPRRGQATCASATRAWTCSSSARARASRSPTRTSTGELDVVLEVAS